MPARATRSRFPKLRSGMPAAARLLTAGGMLVLIGCAGATSGSSGEGSGLTVMTGDGVSYTFDRAPVFQADQSVTLSPEEAWSVLPWVYQALGLEVETRVDAQRRLGSGPHRFSGSVLNRRPSDFFDCGTDPGLMRPLADQSPIDARVVTTVVAGSDGTAQLRTEVSGSARRTGGTAGRAECRSTGLLEGLIARMVEGDEG
jgi:hypothetical protein